MAFYDVCGGPWSTSLATVSWSFQHEREITSPVSGECLSGPFTVGIGFEVGRRIHLLV